LRKPTGRLVRSFFSYIPADSRILGVSPDLKFSYFLVFNILAFTIYGLAATAVLFLISVLVMVASGVSLGRIKTLFFIILGMLQFIALWNIFFSQRPGGEILVWPWGVHLTTGGIVWALTNDLRFCTMVFATMYLFLTARDRDIVLALRDFRLPRTVRFVVALMFRSLGLFFDDFKVVKEAMMSRGVSFRGGSVKQRIQRNYRLGIPLTLIMLRRASDIAFALDARRFQTKGVKPTTYSRARMRPVEWLATATLWAGLIFTLLYQNLWGRPI